MYYLYYDSGTTNTRGYLIADGKILATASLKVGSKDASFLGSPRPLLQAIEQIKEDLLAKADLGLGDIEGVYLSGMATSRFGFRDIPHLFLPVDRRKLKSSIVTVQDSHVFGRLIGLIPGLKTGAVDNEDSWADLAGIHNLRGEETEMLGLFDALDLTGEHVVLILPGSHTQFIFVFDNTAYDLLSTISGELYQAISEKTVLAGALDSAPLASVDEAECVWTGYQLLMRHGLNRALYIVHASNLFGSQTPKQRSAVLNGILEGDALQEMQRRLQQAGTKPDRFILAGNATMCRVDAAILRRLRPDTPICLYEPKDDLPLAVRGFLSLLRE